jgi:type II secretory pathway component PulF
MVRSGESSGSLVEVLRRMAAHYQQFSEVQGKFVTAMIYPMMVCLVGVGLMLFFMYFMLPRFIEMFQGFNVDLPLPTRMLISIGYIFSHLWTLLLMVIVTGLIIFGIARFKATEEGRRKFDLWKMNAPIFGKVVKLNLFAQF